MQNQDSLIGGKKGKGTNREKEIRTTKQETFTVHAFFTGFPSKMFHLSVF